MNAKPDITPPTCPYCGQASKLVDGDVIYPRRNDLYQQKFWLCAPCDAFVGTHKNSPRYAPLGRLANAGLRKAKQQAHAAFDPIWRNGDMVRQDAYGWLAEVLDIPVAQCHIGMFDESGCQRVVDVCRNYRVVFG